MLKRDFPDHHYCDTCSDHEQPVDFDVCKTCHYDPASGFTNWTPIKPMFNGTTMYDIVNKPKHYMLMDNLEVRDVLAALVSKMRKPDDQVVPNNALFESDYVQMMQYLMRFMDKNGKQDLEKAQWYLKKLIDSYD